MNSAYAGPDRRQDSGNVPFWFPTIRGFLTVAIVMLIVAIVLILMLRPPQVDERISNLLSGILGILVACFKDVFAYNFSSTQESTDKNRTIAAQGAALATSVPTAPTTTTVTTDPGPPPTTTVKTEPAEPKPKTETPPPG